MQATGKTILRKITGFTTHEIKGKTQIELILAIQGIHHLRYSTFTLLLLAEQWRCQKQQNDGKEKPESSSAKDTTRMSVNRKAIPAGMAFN